MKSGIHPAYNPVLFYDTSADTYILTRSTRTSTETKLWSDGNTYPVIRVDISSASHPFWTGNQRVIDTAGQVEKFRRRYGARGDRPERQR
jgi:large subunit ribosomal protein L31